MKKKFFSRYPALGGFGLGFLAFGVFADSYLSQTFGFGVGIVLLILFVILNGIKYWGK